MYANWPNGWLQLKSTLDPGPWRPVCSVPCDRVLEVEGTEARVIAPGMTPTNSFRIDPGYGMASLRVSGGSSSLRRLGTGVLVGGLVAAAGGASLYGYGRIDEQGTLVTFGTALLIVSAAAVIGSLPLLAFGNSRVRDARGHTIAQREALARF